MSEGQVEMEEVGAGDNDDAKEEGCSLLLLLLLRLLLILLLMLLLLRRRDVAEEPEEREKVSTGESIQSRAKAYHLDNSLGKPLEKVSTGKSITHGCRRRDLMFARNVGENLRL